MNKIQRTNHCSYFTLVGTPRLNDNTFKIDTVSDNGWQYNQLNLALDCGEKHGFVYSSMMGGFSTVRDNAIYVHGKKEDGGDEFKNQFQIPWDKRFDEDEIANVGDLCFIEVGLEVTNEGNLFTKKFLSAYDAIAYIANHLTEDMTVSVQGMLKYSLYNGKTTMQKEITSIKLTQKEPSATFVQSVLIDEDSVNKNEDIDKENKHVTVHAMVLDYVKEINGVDIRSQYPLYFDFDYYYNDPETFKKQYKYMFDVKGDKVKQINFEGEFISSGATIEATMDDVDDDVKMQIDLGLRTKEEVLTMYATQGPAERKCVLIRPRIVGDTKEVQIYEDKYTKADLDVFNDVHIPTAEPIAEEDDWDFDDMF